MINPRLRARYRRIVWFFLRLTLGLAFWEVLLPMVGLGSLSRRTRSRRYQRIAADFRSLAIGMGGVMIKVGQFLSARLDVLPPEITAELADLQDEVPPEEFAAIRALAESELGRSLELAFDEFEATPLAAASLGQVHRARLRPDAAEAEAYRDVVVKIQRPNIEQLVDVDFAALRRFGGWLRHYGPIRRRVDVPALIQELSDTVHNEINYIAEGQNAEIFSANFANRERVRVPRVAWSHTTRRVLTLENVYAIKITDYPAIDSVGVSRQAVARVLFDTYLRQIFEDHFFHADPHPGNLFVDPKVADSDGDVAWRLTFVDFGMVGTVPESLQRGLRDLLVGIGTRDAGKVVEAYQTIGVLLPGADLELLERAEAHLFDRFWGMSMSQLRKLHHSEMREFASEFRGLMYSMPFQLPQNLLLLGRTLAILSGMCTGLDPEFNLWEQLAPYARSLVAGEGTSSWSAILEQAGDLLRELLAFPSQAGRVLTRIERGDLKVDTSDIRQEIRSLESAVNRLLGGVIFAAFVSAGVLLYRGGDQSLGYVFWGLAALSLVWTALLGRGRPR